MSGPSRIPYFDHVAVHPAGSGEEVVEKKLEDRTVLVVLRQGTATPHGEQAPQAKEIVSGVSKWTMTDHETLELYSADLTLVATFRDWSFVKFVEPRTS